MKSNLIVYCSALFNGAQHLSVTTVFAPSQPYAAHFYHHTSFSCGRGSSTCRYGRFPGSSTPSADLGLRHKSTGAAICEAPSAEGSQGSL